MNEKAEKDPWNQNLASFGLLNTKDFAEKELVSDIDM